MVVTWNEEMIATVHKLRDPETAMAIDAVAAKIGVCRETLVRWMRKNDMPTGTLNRAAAVNRVERPRG